MLDRDEIFAFVPDLGGGKRLVGVAARFWRRVDCLGFVQPLMQVGDVGFLFVFHAHQRSREPRDLEILGQHQRDRLAAEHDLVVVQRPERRTARRDVVHVGAVGAGHRRAVLVRQHGDHAFDRHRLADIDAAMRPFAMVDATTLP